MKPQTDVYLAKLRREVRADPRTYERGCGKVISTLYNIDISTVYRWRKEFMKEINNGDLG